MKPRPRGLHHVAIKSSDPERLAAFYRDVLGLEEVARHAMPDDALVLRSVWLAAGDVLLMIERAAAAPAASAEANRASAGGFTPPELATNCEGRTNGPQQDREGTGARGAAPPACNDPPGLHLLALAVAPADMGTWRARLEAAAHPIVHATAFSIYVQDPDGNRVGLCCYDSSSVLPRTPPARSDS